MLLGQLAAERLAASLARRAAAAYQETGLWRRAAEMWLELGQPAAAAAVCQRAGAWRRAAQLWLTAGEPDTARECFRRLLATPSPEPEDEVAACLGIALCGRQAAADDRRNEAEQFFRRAWRLLTGLDGRQPLRHGRCWEQLALYGRELGRYDLLQIGYQRALDCYGPELNSERLRVIHDYRAAVAGNRRLAAELETMAAEWQLLQGEKCHASV